MDLKQYIDKAMTYAEYRNMIDGLLEQGKTTGPDQSAEMVAYAKLNQHRMQRIEKTVQLNNDLQVALKAIQLPTTVLIITEGWCGDAAQIVPLFGAMEGLNPLLKIKLVLRDEHVELIDAYLTNGGRAIPKIIFVDDTTGTEKAVWGPRPQVAQLLMDDLKKKNASLDEKKEALHLWYGRDRTTTTQKEITEVLKKV